MADDMIYHQVGAHQAVADRDIVIEIVPGENCPLAAITDPRGTSKSRPMPVPQALKVVENEIALEPGYLELVIIDDGGLWCEEWGKLIPHPDRANPKTAPLL
ncbi:MAG: hypothetical protein JWM58_2514 [Rhizobium sp.]|nr:hypothetical protein [Rhizobium sp.]